MGCEGLDTGVLSKAGTSEVDLLGLRVGKTVTLEADLLGLWVGIPVALGTGSRQSCAVGSDQFETQYIHVLKNTHL